MQHTSGCLCSDAEPTCMCPHTAVRFHPMSSLLAGRPCNHPWPLHYRYHSGEYRCRGSLARAQGIYLQIGTSPLLGRYLSANETLGFVHSTVDPFAPSTWTADHDLPSPTPAPACRPPVRSCLYRQAPCSVTRLGNATGGLAAFLCDRPPPQAAVTTTTTTTLTTPPGVSPLLILGRAGRPNCRGIKTPGHAALLPPGQSFPFLSSSSSPTPRVRVHGHFLPHALSHSPPALVGSLVR